MFVFILFFFFFMALEYNGVKLFFSSDISPGLWDVSEIPRGEDPLPLFHNECSQSARQAAVANPRSQGLHPERAVSLWDSSPRYWSSKQ